MVTGGCSWSDPLQLSESSLNHYIWEICSANWWDAQKTATPAASIGQQKGPNSSPWQLPTALGTTNTSKAEWIGLRGFASFTTFSWSLASRLPLLQTYQQLFGGKTLPQPAGGRNALHEFVKSQSVNFYAIGIIKLISCWQKYIDCNGSYFD